MPDHDGARETPGSAGLRPAMVLPVRGDGESYSPRSGPVKAVSIAEPEISPIIQPLDSQPIKQFSASVAKRLTGRPSTISHSSSKVSLASQSQASLEDLPAAALSYKEEGKHKHHHHHHHHNKISPQDRLLSQIAEWIQTEKTKKAAKKAKRKEAKEKQGATHLEIAITTTAQRRESSDSDSSGLSLDKLQKILEDDKQASRDPTPTASPNLLPRSPNLLPRRPSYSSRKKSGSRSRRPSVPPRAASSDTEYYDGDAIVPSCDVVLDNSKTLSYTGGAAVTPSVSTASSDLSLGSIAKKAEKESNVWSVFKHEILKLAHTLRLKGWRRIPLEKGDDIEVVRLSGALTNAVYVVLPPKDHPLPKHHGEHAHETPRPRKPPAKLLLRIYGPQVEHLIDRESELSILRRLARKKIGPRMLGTFRNGRFEEYFDSTTLTAEDLRIKETSRAIAKRMRELHEGIELEEEEREAGPRVWGNWEKWVGRCEIVIGWLDKQVLAQGGAKSGKDAWRRKGFVCGVRWPMFRAMVEKYRRRLEEEYGGKGGIKEKLVFAHNDTQYGNILRLSPSTTSPLLLPSNSHRQLVVIDFEYASANTPGLEFANHFSEWCYNYHDSVAPHLCRVDRYPTLEQQKTFLKAYVEHSVHGPASGTQTPKTTPAVGAGGVSGISAFMLDSRTPSRHSATGLVHVENMGSNAEDAERDRVYKEEEERRARETEEKVKKLLWETRLWRVANSAQWVAWGIVQASVPGLEEEESEGVKEKSEEPEQRLQSPPHTNTADHAFGRPETLVAQAMLSGDKDALSEAIEEEKLEQAAEAEAEAAKAESEAAEAAGSEGEHDDAEVEFDYLAYAQERAMFFWGDCIGLGLTSWEELEGWAKEGAGSRGMEGWEEFKKGIVVLDY